MALYDLWNFLTLGREPDPPVQPTPPSPPTTSTTWRYQRPRRSRKNRNLIVGKKLSTEEAEAWNNDTVANLAGQLDADPTKTELYLILADALQDAGELTVSYALRWMAKHGYAPKVLKNKQCQLFVYQNEKNTKPWNINKIHKFLTASIPASSRWSGSFSTRRVKTFTNWRVCVRWVAGRITDYRRQVEV